MSQKVEKKKSRWSQFAEWLIKRDKEEPEEVKLQGLPEHAVKIVMDKKLQERMAEYQEFLKLINQPIQATTVNELIDEITDLVQVTNTCVLRVASVYADAGDTKGGAKLMRGWNTLASIYIGHCECCKIWFSSDAKLDDQHLPIQLTHIQNLRLALRNHYFRQAQNVLSYCFKDKDVRPFSVTLIQSMSPLQPQQGQGLNQMQNPDSKDY